MNKKDFFDKYSQTVEMAECRISDYKEFNEKYNFLSKDFFINKLTEMGYDEKDINAILINKDLLLTLFMNSFETIVLESDIETNIGIDLDIERARKKYIDAVDTANQSIDAANEAQKIMMALKALNESKYGYDSNKWDEQSVHEMNESIKVYNRLVEKANKDTEKTKVARKELAKVRKEKEIKIINTKDIVLETS